MSARPMNARLLMRSAACLALGAGMLLSGCKSAPQVYQPPDRTHTPEPKQAAIANMQMAIEYMRINNLARARERIERALNEDPDNPTVQETAGLVYEKLNEMPKAQKAFDRAVKLGKGDPAIQNSYAGFLCRTGKAAAGEKIFNEVAKNPAYPTPWVALVNAGVCVGSTGDVVDAERYFKAALALRPTLAEALYEMGNLDLERGDAQQALEYVQKYQAVHAPTPESLWLGYRVDRKLGDASGAANYARRIQTEFPDSEPAQALRSGSNQ